MLISDKWEDYALLDASDGYRLERFGEIYLIRPDAQIVWKSEINHPRWNDVHAKFVRSSKGGGVWQKFKKIPDTWTISHENLTFNLSLMGFKHVGVFMEQAAVWSKTSAQIKQIAKLKGEPAKILNLFAYTGGATLTALAENAHVTHVDASKGMVERAKMNAKSSKLNDKPVRWLIDDCLKFVEREIRRGNKYDGIIMDPPSYGRGPSGELWQLEDKIFEFVSLTARLLEKRGFMVVNSYSTGISHKSIDNILKIAAADFGDCKIESDVLGLPVKNSDLVLPCGASSRITVGF